MQLRAKHRKVSANESELYSPKEYIKWAHNRFVPAYRFEIKRHKHWHPIIMPRDRFEAERYVRELFAGDHKVHLRYDWEKGKPYVC